MINFDKTTHTYTLDNKQLISCTELLHRHNLAPDYSQVDRETLQKSADRGTLIHEEIENWCKNNNYEQFTKECANFIKFVLDNEITPIANEKVVYNDLVAGTCDFIYLDKNGKKHRADFKTTSSIQYDYVSWQLSLYEYLDKEKTDFIEVWHFDKDGTLKIRELTLKPIGEIERLLDAERNNELYVPNTISLAPNELLQVETLQKIIEHAKKEQEQAENQLKTLSETLLERMEENGVKKVETDYFILTYVAPSIRETLDSKKLKENDRETYDKYIKKSNIKASLKITLKGKEK